MKAMSAAVAVRPTAMFVLMLVALVSVAGQAHARRVALVIGNDAYQNFASLQRAVSDAEAVSAALRDDLEFDLVITGTNLTRVQAVTKFAEFERELEPGDTAFFFFSGHGVAPKDRNLLLPIDFPRDATQDTAEDLSQAVDSLITRVREKRALGIFVLDACRDNPLPNAFKSIGHERGLAPISHQSGTFVLLSAGIRQRALDRLSGDDKDTTSVFTRKLLPLLKTRGLSLASLAKRVQTEVANLAETQNHEQVPEYRDSIRGDFYMLPGSADAVAVEQPDVTEKRPEEALRPIGELPAVTDFAVQETRPATDAEQSGEAVATLSGSTHARIDEDVERPSAETAKNAAACDRFTIDAEILAGLKDFGDFDPRRLRKDVALESCGDLLKAMPDSPTAQAQMALVLFGAERNEEALPLFRKSAEQGIVLSMLSLGRMHIYGLGAPYDSDVAFDWLSRAAETGSTEGAQLAQSIALTGVVGGTSDQALDFLQKRANRGDAYAMYVIARQYADGKVVTSDPKAAARWLMFSVRKGSIAARKSLQQDSTLPWPTAVLVEVQRKLAEAGQYEGALDGKLGAGSQQALDALLPKG